MVAAEAEAGKQSADSNCENSAHSCSIRAVVFKLVELIFRAHNYLANSNSRLSQFIRPI